MSALAHPDFNSAKRQVHRAQTQEDDINTVTGTLPGLDSVRRVRPLSVVSNAKSARSDATRSISRSTCLAAAMAANSG